MATDRKPGIRPGWDAPNPAVHSAFAPVPGKESKLESEFWVNVSLLAAAAILTVIVIQMYRSQVDGWNESRLFEPPTIDGPTKIEAATGPIKIDVVAEYPRNRVAVDYLIDITMSDGEGTFASPRDGEKSVIPMEIWCEKIVTSRTPAKCVISVWPGEDLQQGIDYARQLAALIEKRGGQRPLENKIWVAQ